MKFKTGSLGLMALAGILFLSGCSQVDKEMINDENPAQSPAIIVTEEDATSEETTANPAAGISEKIDESTARAMQFDKLIEGIKNITLRDVEDNIIERTFTADEIIAIETAFNESYIMDTMYIQMIAGYNMTIELENGEEVFITSYGDPVFIVARVGDETYHLGCETIATILLEGMN
jgi:PBP1b-binding outer membrane lipoprotein LpoB